MKKYILLFVLISLFLILPSINVSAEGLNVSFLKSVLNPGETAQAKVVIDSIRLVDTLSIGDFSLYDFSGTRLTVNMNLVKINDEEYYVYFDVPRIFNSSFNFGAYGLKYFLGDVFHKDDFFIPLSTNNEASALSVRPGAVSLLDIESFDQPVINFNVKAKGDVDVKISSSNDFLVPVFSGFSLKDGESKNFDVKTKLVGKVQDEFNGNVLIEYGDNIINVPVYITRKGFVKVNNSVAGNNDNNSIAIDNALPEPVAQEGSLKLVDPVVSEVKTNLDYKEVVSGEFIFRNDGNTGLENVVVSYKGLEEILNVDKAVIDYWPAGSEVTLRLTADASKATKESYSGKLLLLAENGAKVELPVFFNAKLEGESIVDVPVVNETKSLPSAVDSSVQEDSFFNLWVGFLVILILIVLVIWYLYKKQKPKRTAYESMVESFKHRQ